MGGSNGAAQDPTAYIVPARRVVRLRPPANDNRAPLGWRVRRLVVYLLILALIAGIVFI
ncbi:hypothetical protein [Azospirillum picis]|uniref:Uncharacterized protein n=1 Tax=Azospirillum picis TaxID=488438 RepID=A0ABU0MG31_9PROT|nr:hypothetical protein [Azospirillum picis]MBP2298565.1 hypothetical protein [Azospirillum picis]MDQ0532386.1 hypothetical protein [Azospirillum picis]